MMKAQDVRLPGPLVARRCGQRGNRGGTSRRLAARPEPSLSARPFPMQPKRALRRLPAIAAVALAAALAGCANLAPSYTRPEAPVAAAWPSTPSGGAEATIDWRAFFVDDRLRRVVEFALAGNRDLRSAALDIDRARAQYRIQQADRFPAVDAGGSASRARSLSNGSATTRTQYAVDLGLAGYEIDLFGRVRNLSESALQSYFATEEARRATQISLVAEVANAWLTLAADEARLGLARDTLKSQQASYDLTRRSHELGAQSGLSLYQAQSTVDAARVDVGTYTTRVAQDRNALDLLAGAPVPPELLPGDERADATVLVDVPAGLPSAVLQQRPDVLAAEHALQAAQADIGAARAAFYPRISLTAAAGVASTSLGDLFQGASRVWSFAPSISLPIFDAGANQARLDVAQVDREARLATYEKTLQTAFREVADALADRATLAERLDAQRSVAEATGKSFELSQARFRSGADSYLEVLDAQRSLYGARQNLISLRLAEQSNRIALYKALGGGWQVERVAGR